MKINAENFLDNFSKYIVEENIYFVSGNESGMILSVEKLLIKELNKNSDCEVKKVDNKNIKNEDFDNITKSSSLFEKKNIVVFNNPGSSFLDILNDTNFKNNTIIIKAENVNNSSKIKKFFDSHKKFISISCYKISSAFKKRTIDTFLNKKDLKLDKDAYWFFLENSSNEFQLLQNDLTKIYDYGKKSVTLNELRKIISNNSSVEMEELFFQCFTSNKELILSKTNLKISSLAEAYNFLQTFKRYAKILVFAVEEKSNKDVESLTNYFLPKYLFRQKENFKTILKKSNLEKLSKIYKLIQKTELYLRKNDSHFLIIIQRFMLNCSQALK